MANPAIKNGYVPLANELIEHLATVNIPGQEWRIIMVLLRKTWGWKQDNRRKDWDWISITQFEKATGMKKANVYSSLKSLLVKRIILKQENLLKFNQNYNEWLLVKRLPPLVKSIIPISQLTNKTISQKHNNKINKKTNTKEILSVAKATVREPKISYKLISALKEFSPTGELDGDYKMDNLFPAKVVAKQIAKFIGKELDIDNPEHHEEIIAQFKGLISKLDEFERNNATKMSYIKYNFNRLAAKASKK